ncbi:hypothetical protein [Enterococcus sp. LJL51]|uniref:hypothetical protein n=1 Tax=Enterococcus sp. LJL51 TaxID=3416656 RepID=UPI003CF9A6BD
MMTNKNFSIITTPKEHDNLMYEDASCVIKCNIADFRDEVYWILLLSVKDKKTDDYCQLTSFQQAEILRRINYWTLKEYKRQLFETEAGFIETAPDNLEVPLLEMT